MIINCGRKGKAASDLYADMAEHHQKFSMNIHLGSALQEVLDDNLSCA